MSVWDSIQSADNARLKLARAVRAGKVRDRVLLEGERLLGEALDASAQVEWVLQDGEQSKDLLRRAEADGAQVAVCSRDLLDKDSDLDSPRGLLALAVRPEVPWEKVMAQAAPGAPLLVAAGVQDPGNLGALVRVAAGLGAAGFLALKGSTSPWSPRALRGAAGTTFRLPVAAAVERSAFLQKAQEVGVVLWAAEASGGEMGPIPNCPLALILGEEGRGLPEDLVTAVDQTVAISLRRSVDSLNVATAAAVLLHQIVASGRAEGATD